MVGVAGGGEVAGVMKVVQIVTMLVKGSFSLSYAMQPPCSGHALGCRFHRKGTIR